CPHHHDSY
ncbi:thiosulfate sulfurtransferase domain protein, partial [Vibrio parahaemolyticus V-223/04]